MLLRRRGTSRDVAGASFPRSLVTAVTLALVMVQFNQFKSTAAALVSECDDPEISHLVPQVETYYATSEFSYGKNGYELLDPTDGTVNCRSPTRLQFSLKWQFRKGTTVPKPDSRMLPFVCDSAALGTKWVIDPAYQMTTDPKVAGVYTSPAVLADCGLCQVNAAFWNPPDECVAACPDGTTPDAGRTCLEEKCAESLSDCETCTNGGTVCTTCKAEVANRFVVEGRCRAECGAGTYGSEATGFVCRAVQTCKPVGQEWEKAPPTPTTDRVCEPVTPCPDSQFASAPATARANTVCQDPTVCGAGEFERSTFTPTKDRVCLECPVGCDSTGCSSPGGVCKQCGNGYFRTDPMAPCEPCDCNLAHTQPQRCGADTGVCACKPGFTGDCTSCEDGKVISDEGGACVEDTSGSGEGGGGEGGSGGDGDGGDATGGTTGDGKGTGTGGTGAATGGDGDGKGSDAGDGGSNIGIYAGIAGGALVVVLAVVTIYVVRRREALKRSNGGAGGGGLESSGSAHPLQKRTSAHMMGEVGRMSSSSSFQHNLSVGRESGESHYENKAEMEPEPHYENHDHPGGNPESAYAAVDRTKGAAAATAAGAAGAAASGGGGGGSGHYEDTLASSGYDSLDRRPLPLSGYQQPMNNQPVLSHYMATSEATGKGDVQQQQLTYADLKISAGNRPASTASIEQAAPGSSSSSGDGGGGGGGEGEDDTVYSSVATMPADVQRSGSVGSRVNPEASLNPARLSGDYEQTG